jgi:hypothetical protein
MSKGLVLLMLASAPAFAQTREIAPLIGVQGGGTVEVNQLNTSLDPSAAFGVMLSFDRGRGRKLDLVAIGQHTKAERNDPFEPPASAGVSVEHFHIGGRYIFDPDARTQPYVAATIGLTRIAINELYSLYPSIAFGGGADFRITRTLLFRLDGRGYTTLTQTSANVSCDNSGTCAGTASGRTFTQVSLTTGLVVRF